MHPTLERQLSALGEWLVSSDALGVTRGILVKRRLASVDADALLNEAWLAAQRTFGRRSEPYTDLEGPESVRRFGYRMIDNLAIDHLRRDARRAEVTLVEDGGMVEGGFETIDQHDLLIRLIESVPDVARQLPSCPGCAGDVVVALALDICQSLLADPGDDHFDDLVYAGLRRVLGEQPAAGPATPAERQRKARCGRCTRLLLEAALDASGVTA